MKMKMKMRNQQEYSYYAKRAQVIILAIGVGVMIFKTCMGYGHLELHFHSSEWDAEQKMRESREPLVEEYRLLNPDASEEEAKEVEEEILQGKRMTA